MDAGERIPGGLLIVGRFMFRRPARNSEIAVSVTVTRQSQTSLTGSPWHLARALIESGRTCCRGRGGKTARHPAAAHEPDGVRQARVCLSVCSDRSGSPTNAFQSGCGRTSVQWCRPVPVPVRRTSNDRSAASTSCRISCWKTCNRSLPAATEPCAIWLLSHTNSVISCATASSQQRSRLAKSTVGR